LEPTRRRDNPRAIRGCQGRKVALARNGIPGSFAVSRRRSGERVLEAVKGVKEVSVSLEKKEAVAVKNRVDEPLRRKS